MHREYKALHVADLFLASFFRARDAGPAEISGECRADAAALAEAARDTLHQLRYGAAWSLLNSHLLTARLVDAASVWLAGGDDQRDALRRLLREAAAAAHELDGQEAEWRQVTERVLAAVPSSADDVDPAAQTG